MNSHHGNIETDDLRILYVSAVDLSAPTGPGVNENEFVNSLQRRFGQNARFVVPQPSCPLDFDTRQFAFVPRAKSYLGHFAQQRRIYRKILQLEDTEPIDFIVARLPIFPRAMQLYTRSAHALLRSCPPASVVVKTLGDATLTYLRQKNGLKGVIARSIYSAHLRMQREVLLHATALDTCTPQLIEGNIKVHGLPCEKFIEVGNAVNTERFYPQCREESRTQLKLDQFDPIIGYVGGVPWERGGLEMIEVLPRLLVRFPNAGCVIVGGGSGLEQLRNRAIALGVEGRCVMPGAVPYDDIPDWINAFDVGVAFDLPDRAVYIGSSNQKIRQYVACGIPSVVTPGGGGNSFIEENKLGTIVNYGAPDEFANALTYWMDASLDIRSQLKNRAVEFAREHLSADRALEDRIRFWLARRAEYSESRAAAA